MHHAIFDDSCSEHDTRIHLAIRSKIADATAIRPAFISLELVDDLHRSHFRCSRYSPGRKPGRERIEDIIFRIKVALDIRDDMHDMAVALEKEAVRYRNGTDFRDTADIIATKIKEHQMFCALFLVSQKLIRIGLVLSLGCAARTRSRDGPDCNPLISNTNENFWR